MAPTPKSQKNEMVIAHELLVGRETSLRQGGSVVALGRHGGGFTFHAPRELMAAEEICT